MDRQGPQGMRSTRVKNGAVGAGGMGCKKDPPIEVLPNGVEAPIIEHR